MNFPKCSPVWTEAKKLSQPENLLIDSEAQLAAGQ